MNNRNLLLKIIKFALIVGSPFMGNRLLAEDLKICPEHLTKLGTKVQMLDNNQSIITITKYISLKNALNNESLQEHIALLKLETVEEFQKYLKSTLTVKKTKYGGEKKIVTYNNSWDQMKRSIASMKEKYICIDKGSNKDAIIFTGEWYTKSVKIVDRIIEYRNAHAELMALRREDPKFDLKKILGKYPNLLKGEDPKIIKDVINNWKKNRRF